MSANGKQTPKDAALIVLRRAADETEPVVMAALIAVAIKQVEQIQELVKPRKPKAAEGVTT
jgi:hypothetical protein